MNKTTILLTIILALLISNNLNAQNGNTTKDSLETTIKYHDSIFWKAFNSCDLNIMKQYVSDDLEFYHDKDGLTKGAESFLKVTNNNLCSNRTNWLLRREAVDKSIKIYPIKNYGAIISGEHLFFVTENSKPEYQTGIAQFTNIWELKNNLWKMTRVLSYDHKEPAQNTDKQEIILPNEFLNTFVGQYNTHNTGEIIVTKKGNQLQIKAGDMLAIVYAQSESLFFSKQRPLTFEFILNKKNIVYKMIVREKRTIVEEAIKL